MIYGHQCHYQIRIPLSNHANGTVAHNAPILSLAACPAVFAVAAGNELTNSQAAVTIW